MKFYVSVLLVSLYFVSPFPCNAEILLSISSSNPSPFAIQIGEEITVDVGLSGLSAGNELDSLAATIVFDSSAWSIPTIVLGPVVPDPLADITDLLTIADAGLVDFSFLTFGADSAHRITANGLLFSFTAQAISAIEGEFAFEFVDATAFNSSNPNSPLPLDTSPGDPLEVHIVVPEPATLSMLCFAVLLATSALRRLKS